MMLLFALFALLTLACVVTLFRVNYHRHEEHVRLRGKVQSLKDELEHAKLVRHYDTQNPFRTKEQVVMRARVDALYTHLGLIPVTVLATEETVKAVALI